MPGKQRRRLTGASKDESEEIMEIKLVKDYFKENMAIPKGHEEEVVSWDWTSGGIDYWQRDESGEFPDWLGYKVLMTKLEQWERRDAEEKEDAIRVAWINIGRGGFLRSRTPIQIDSQRNPDVLKVVLSEENEYKNWTDLRPLIDYLIDNMDTIRAAVRLSKEKEQDIRRNLASNILSMRV